jgi:hypothetical protein
MNTPIPFFVPIFWYIVLKTAWLKWQHRRRGNGVYTDYLREFYSNQVNPHVEAYGDAYMPLRPLMIDLAALEPGDTILDIATGKGYQAAAFARQGHFTLGIDYVYDRVALAAEMHDLHNIAWSVADAPNLPFATNSFDVVTLSLALHDMPRSIQVATLRELRRVARRRVIVAEPRPPNMWLGRHLYGAIGELIDESIHFREFALRRFEDVLNDADLRLLQWQRCYYGVLAVYVCDPSHAQ